ncbi:MAG: ATP-binding protein [Lachnospiraceae bacterium]|nr:ATP-binding protein [Lachnospiraceae bacterium]
MRPLNIYALTRMNDPQTLGRMEKQLSRRSRMLRIREWELKGLRAFSDKLCALREDAAGLEFYYSFTMPKLGKEFDLLRINEECVINIELKSGDVSDEVIRRQLQQNRYYLTTLGRSMYFYTYVDREDRLLRLSNAGHLLEADWQELSDLLAGQRDCMKGPIEELFREDSYLISPLSDTARFLRRDYFLTFQQRDIRKQILKNIEQNRDEPPMQGFSGAPGTGKTLLLYDLAMELSQNEAVCVLHFGTHARELEVLDERLKRVDFIYCEKGTVPSIPKAYKAILVDEGHRLDRSALDAVLSYAKEWKAPVIFSYDCEDVVALQEREAEGAEILEALPGYVGFRLTNRIRLNSELSSFIRGLLCLRECGRRKDFPSVQLFYAADAGDQERLMTYLRMQGFTYVQSGAGECGGIEAAEAACKEYEKLMMLLDGTFTYDEKGFLRSSEQGRVRNVFSGLSRARKELAVIVRENEVLFSQIMKGLVP